jgi:hypothetical protein
MTMTESPEFFTAAVARTPINSLCVKKRGKGLRELIDDDYGHGRIVSPSVVVGQVANEQELHSLLVDELKEPFVTVRGHGWPGEKRFVWSGTTREFFGTWVVD